MINRSWYLRFDRLERFFKDIHNGVVLNEQVEEDCGVVINPLTLWRMKKKRQG